jgi:hypothetical protein
LKFSNVTHIWYYFNTVTYRCDGPGVFEFVFNYVECTYMYYSTCHYNKSFIYLFTYLHRSGIIFYWLQIISLFIISPRTMWWYRYRHHRWYFTVTNIQTSFRHLISTCKDYETARVYMKKAYVRHLYINSVNILTIIK